MQTLKITMELTLAQARQLFGAEYGLIEAPKKTRGSAEGKSLASSKGPGKGRGFAPQVPAVSQYINTGSEPTGRPGRQSRLTTEGMAYVWDLYKSGYSINEIHEPFKSVIGREAIRRLIKKIIAAGQN